MKRTINIDNLMRFYREEGENLYKKDYLSYDEQNLIRIVLENKYAELSYTKITLNKVEKYNKGER